MNVRRVGILLMCAVSLAPIFAHAQLSLYFNRPLTLTLSPENPAPGETVHLSIASYAIDLDRSIITWKADDVVFEGGAGVKEASITVGEAGSMTKITVEAQEQNGDVAYTEATIRPSEIDLLWTTDSYVPPFFKGRKFAGTEAAVRAYAFVRFSENGAPVAENDIIYTWSRNGSALANVSGRGKSRATIPGPVRGTDTITVIAETASRSQRAETSASITAHEAKLILYENHPLFGILFHRAIVGDVNTVERELKVTSVPYFARAQNPNTLTYDWIVNGSPIEPDPLFPETLTIAANDYSGPADIELSATNPDDILMRSVGAWRLIFGGSGGLFFDNSLFGE